MNSFAQRLLRALVLCAVAVSFVGLSRAPASAEAQMHPMLKLLRQQGAAVTGRNFEAFDRGGLLRLRPSARGVSIQLIGAGDDRARQALRARGFEIPRYFKGRSVFTATAPLTGLRGGGEGVSGLLTLRPSFPLRPVLNLSVPDLFGGAEPTSFPYAGDGVVVGLVDSGVDIYHPDFDDGAGGSRVVRYWEQLTNTVGGAAVVCGDWACDSYTALVCVDPGLNACGVCGTVPAGGCADEISALGDGCWDRGDARVGGVVAFGCGSSADPRGSALLSTREGENPDKATLDLRAWDGCGGGVGATLAEITAMGYTWQVANDGTFSWAAPAVKLIIDTADADGTSAAKFETIGDKILVYEPYLQDRSMIVEDAWITQTITLDEGLWWLVDLTPGGSSGVGGISRSDLRTLGEWRGTFGAAGLASSDVTSVQLGVGSYNAGSAERGRSLLDDHGWRGSDRRICRPDLRHLRGDGAGERPGCGEGDRGVYGARARIYCG